MNSKNKSKVNFKKFHNEDNWMTPWIASYHTNAKIEVDIGNNVIGLVSNQWLSETKLQFVAQKNIKCQKNTNH